MPEVMVLGGEPLGGARSLMSGIRDLKKEAPKRSLVTLRTQREGTGYEWGRGPSPKCDMPTP